MKILYYEDGAKNTVFLTNNPIFEGPQLYNISFFKKTYFCLLSNTQYMHFEWHFKNSKCYF